MSVDVAAIAEKWLQQCGPCDGGLPVGCSHPTEDYRPVILALCDEVDRLRATVARVEALADEWDRGVDHTSDHGWRSTRVEMSTRIRAALEGQ